MRLLAALRSLTETSEVAPVVSDDWWRKMSRDEQREYLREHPRSKYAGKLRSDGPVPGEAAPQIPSKPSRHAAPEVRVHGIRQADQPSGAGLHPAPEDRAHWPQHIQALRLPPAWTGVRISHDPHANLQAIGKDAKGRDQYVYSMRFSKSQAALKFARINELHDKLPEIKNQIREAQGSQDETVCDHGDCARLVAEMGVRPGSQEDTGADQQAYGATTLEGRHVVSADGVVRLDFIGKKGVHISLPVEDGELADMLRKRAEKAGPDGKLFPKVSDKSLLAYVHTLDGGGFKTKDMRTLKGTTEAHALVSKLKPPTNPAEYKRALREVAKHVASKLGNTPAVALASYISPVVFAPWDSAKPPDKDDDDSFKPDDSSEEISRDADWWDRLSEGEQTKYLDEHPASAFKYGGHGIKPDHPDFQDALRNTSGAKRHPEGIRLAVTRFQKPDQAGKDSVRDGVFFIPNHGNKAVRAYGDRTDKTFHGGSKKFKGTATLKAPIIVKAPTGGKAPEVAYEALYGKEETREMLHEALVTHLSCGGTPAEPNGATYWKYVDRISNFLERFGGNPDKAEYIYNHSNHGNQLRYALQENVVANQLKAHGYDSMLAYGKAKGHHRFTELFDLRHSHYPSSDEELASAVDCDWNHWRFKHKDGWKQQEPVEETASPTPKLRCIVRYNGKLYKAPPGGDHVEALSKVPRDQRRDAMLSGDRLFQTPDGKLLNRRAAQRYALANDLIRPDIRWAYDAPELISEVLRPEALARAELAAAEWWERLTNAERKAYVKEYPTSKYANDWHRVERVKKLRTHERNLKWPPPPDVIKAPTKSPGRAPAAPAGPTAKRGTPQARVYSAIRKRVDAVASAMRFPIKRVHVSDVYSTFKVDGVKLRRAGLAITNADTEWEGHRYKAGDVIIYAPTGLVQDVPVMGVTAHEITHQRFQEVLDVMDREMKGGGRLGNPQLDRVQDAKKYPVASRLRAALFNPDCTSGLEGGVTTYAQLCWSEHRNGKFPGGYIGAVHETLAEMARLALDQGLEPRDLKVAKHWRRLYAAMEDAYEEIHRRRDKPGRIRNPVQIMPATRRRIATSSEDQHLTIWLRGNMQPCRKNLATYAKILNLDGKHIWGVPHGSNSKLVSDKH